MPGPNFVHLHVHSSYSLLEGALPIGKLAEYGAVRREFLTGTPPTSMTFEVSRLFRPEAQIEIEVVAAVPARS